MSVSQQIAAELSRLVGFAGPGSVTVSGSGADGLTVWVELTSVDAIGCGVVEVVASVPRLAGEHCDVLRTWGESLCRRLSYLLESLGLLEIDPQQNELLIRSNPPDRQGSTTTYYEVLLKQDGPGRFVLRRFETVKGGGARTPVTMHLTHEVLRRLVRDLAETVPAGP